MVASGFPDIVVGYRGFNYLIEIKNPEVDASHQALNPEQEQFHAGWPGQCSAAFTFEDCLQIIGYTPEAPNERPAA